MTFLALPFFVYLWPTKAWVFLPIWSRYEYSLGINFATSFSWFVLQIQKKKNRCTCMRNDNHRVHKVQSYPQLILPQIEIDVSDKSYNAPYNYQTMYHFKQTELRTYVQTALTERCVVGYTTVELWDLCGSFIVYSLEGLVINHDGNFRSNYTGPRSN